MVSPVHSLVVATYWGEGGSVTNECESIAREVVARHGLKASRLLFIEHYPEGLWQNSKETFKLIQFEHHETGFANPEWIELHTDVAREMLPFLM